MVCNMRGALSETAPRIKYKLFFISQLRHRPAARTSHANRRAKRTSAAKKNLRSANVTEAIALCDKAVAKPKIMKILTYNAPCV
jgi:lipopolysaccharide biosynthesis protein